MWSNLKMIGAVCAPVYGTPTKWKATLSQRCEGPGGVYNIGNFMALVGGLTIQTLNAPETQTFSAAIWHFLFGSIGASCLTLSMLIHFASGESYHRAFQRQHKPRPDLIRLGDTLSGAGAIILTIAVASYGDATLALIAGTLFSIGKFGSAIFPNAAGLTKPKMSVTLGFRLMSVTSRVPSITALAITLILALKESNSTPDLAITILMLGCYLIWLRADFLLFTLDRKRFFEEITERPAVNSEEPLHC